MIEVLLVKKAANGYVIHVPKGVIKLEAMGNPTIAGNAIELRGQLFSDDGVHLAEGVERGEDPHVVGLALAKRLLAGDFTEGDTINIDANQHTFRFEKQ